MKRTIAGAASAATVVATLGLAATAVPRTATAVPGTDSAADQKVADRPDNRPDPLSVKHAAERQAAVDALVAGKAELTGKGADRTITLASGDEVAYPASQSAKLLTFLIEFGDDEANPAFPDNTAGPLHNEIPEPADVDNTTYWRPDFNRQHFLDMFFNGLADQGGESFKSVYKEMSSGRFDLEGDVSDWVQVPNAASYYSADDGEEPGSLMKEFLEDGADAWYDQQVADGKSPEQIKAYLQSFDVWDRFDHDGDGNYNEPDGYIDHFQAVHAGEDESAGAAPWAIWAHRSSTNVSGDVGPEGNKNGGVEIGDSGLWIRDYTVEPENGGLGVFAHEFAHDLGVPDYYDTQGGDNSTGFWTLMSRGSWLGHGKDTIGTTPNHMGAPDKLFLGWYGAKDLVTVDGKGAAQPVALGPSYHATSRGAQAVAVNLPDGQATIDVVAPDQGTHYLYSGNGNDRTATATSPTVTVPASGDQTLAARASYSLETDWDYTYLRVSDDGGASWDYVETNLSTDTDPQQANRGLVGITGCSGERDADTDECDMAWTDLTADLSAYAGEQVQLQFMTVNDAAYYELGFAVDDVHVGGTLVTDVENGAPDWTLNKYLVLDGPSYVKQFKRYYLAENRQPRGYDKTTFEGPYSYNYPVSAPSQKVDHFTYQDGLLVWYVSGRWEDNDVSTHPGEGYALPVDASPTYRRWTTPTGVASASGDLNAYDATFDVDATDPLHLTSEANGGQHYDVDGHPSIPVFDDSDVNGYFDSSSARASWYSTKVAGVGSMIQVVSSDEATGSMLVKAGRRFVAVTQEAAVSGMPKVGRTLTAVPPTFFQSGVAVSYQWRVSGKPVKGATGQTYKVKRRDAKKAITVVVTGTKAGYDTATSTARAGAAATTLAVKAPGKVAKGERARVVVRVAAATGTPKGKVRATFLGQEVIGKVKHGKVRLLLPAATRPGVHKLVLTFVPKAGFAKSTTTLKIRVTDKG